MASRTEISAVVFELIRKDSPFVSNEVEIKETDKLIGDLFDLGDDVTSIILQAQYRLNIKAPNKLWRNIDDVGGMIDLLFEHSDK